jgi:hypothetical protein
MRARVYFIVVAAIVLSMLPIRSLAQDVDLTANQLGSFATEGSVSWGYRFTTVKGDQSQYDNLFNLHQGFRLMDMNVMGRAPEGSNPFADSYSITASGLGGDPYPGGQLTVRKDKLYDLRVNFRQSYYPWSQNNTDSEVVAGLNEQPYTYTGIVTGLTAHHSWATVRKMGSANLDLQATNHLHFLLEYSRNSRNGMTESTRNLYYPDSPNYWGGFSRANPYVVLSPLDELTNRTAGGISYTFNGWTLRYLVGYQSSRQNSTWENIISPEQSINTSPASVNAITSQELLTSASWSEFRRVSTPVSELSYTARATKWLDLRGSFNYYNYSGPDTIDGSFAGTARTVNNGSTLAPYTLSLTSRSNLSEPNYEVTQGMTANVKPWWNLYADYRFTHTVVDGLDEFANIFNGTVSPNASTTNHWSIVNQFADLNFEFLPATNLVIRAGLRYNNRAVEQFTDGVPNTTISGGALNTSTLTTSSVWPTVSVYYKPVKIFSVRGDFESISSANPYTRISAHTDLSSRFVFRLQPIANLAIEDSLMIRDRSFDASSFHNRYRSNALNVSYDFGSRVSASAGYSYESIFGSDAVLWSATSATTPFNGFERDAFINRVITASLVVKPVKHFGLNASGNFLRTTGASSLYSTIVAPALGAPIVWPPSVGPLTFPLITVSPYYDFAKAGRLSIDLQRTYYVEQLVKGNNFQANMLTIKWTTNLFTHGFFSH